MLSSVLPLLLDSAGGHWVGRIILAIHKLRLNNDVRYEEGLNHELRETFISSTAECGNL